MANILHFKPRAAGSTKRAEAREAAEIIIFPGVRYERLSGDEAAPVGAAAAWAGTGLPAARQG